MLLLYTRPWSTGESPMSWCVRCRSGASWGDAGFLVERGTQRLAKEFAASVHVYSLPQRAGEEAVSLTQRGNARLKQENGTFF